MTDVHESVSQSRRCLIIVPWLQGGGAQAALVEIISRAALKPDVCVLFKGSRNYEAVAKEAHQMILLEYPKNIWGVFKASLSLRHLALKYNRIYSLLLESHLVLGLVNFSALRQPQLALSFHQLPNEAKRGLRNWLTSLLINRCARHACLITAPSHRAVSALLARGWGTGSVVFYEPNLLKTRPSPPVMPAPTGETRLLALGRVVHQKGLDRLSELAGPSSGPFPPTVIRIVGDGEDLDRVRAQQSCLAANLTLEFVPHTNDVWSQLDWCSALLMPSRWELNPLSLHEAWASGRPAITSDLDVFEDLEADGPVLRLTTDNSLLHYVRLLQDQRQVSIWFNQGIASQSQTASRLVKFVGMEG